MQHFVLYFAHLGLCVTLLCVHRVMSRSRPQQLAGQDFGRLHGRLPQRRHQQVAQDRRPRHREPLLQVSLFLLKLDPFVFST